MHSLSFPLLDKAMNERVRCEAVYSAQGEVGHFAGD